MAGEFTLEDKSGNIVFASTPGMASLAESIRSDAKKKKALPKKTTRAVIKIFSDLAELEENDESWEERFQKMSISRFPNKISWNLPSPEKESLIYGILVYKNRQVEKKLELKKDVDLDTLSRTIKAFIQNYTNVDMEENDDADEMSTLIDKSQITPVSWNKLGPRDQSSLIADYVKGFSLENPLGKRIPKTINILDYFYYGKEYHSSSNF